MKAIIDVLNANGYEHKEEIIRKKKVISFIHKGAKFSYKFRNVNGIDIVEVYQEKRRIFIHDVSNENEIVYALSIILDIKQ